MLPLAALAFFAVACSNNNNALTGATNQPSVASTTDIFSGTLTLNGAQTYPFGVQNAGTISAALTTLTPDSTSAIGLSLGTWNGSACQIVLANDKAVQGSSVIGQASALGNFCVRVYDAAGTVTQPESYVVTVSHP